MENSTLRIKVGIVVLGLICSILYVFSMFQVQYHQMGLKKILSSIPNPFRKSKTMIDAIDNNDIRGVRKWVEKDPAMLNRAILQHAIDKDRLEIIQYLVSKGINLDYIPDSPVYPETFLQCSIRQGKRETARILIKGGANVNPETGHSLSPLYLAVEKGWYDVVKMLIARGARIETKDKYNTVIHIAAQKSESGIARLLINNCSNVPELVNSRQYPDDKTPLHLAAKAGSLEIIRLLLKNNANIDARTTEGETPLDYAIVHGQKPAAKYLIEHGADIYPETLTDTCRSPVFYRRNKRRYTNIKTATGKGSNTRYKGWIRTNTIVLCIV